MRDKEIILDEKESTISDFAMALLGILALIPILYVFRLVLLSIANGTLFWPI